MQKAVTEASEGEKEEREERASLQFFLLSVTSRILFCSSSSTFHTSLSTTRGTTRELNWQKYNLQGIILLLSNARALFDSLSLPLS